jgi:hypothetical protein
MVLLNLAVIGVQANYVIEEANRLFLVYPVHFFIRKIYLIFTEKHNLFFINNYRGEPVTQTYRNTDLTLSNLRINDEL